MRTRVCNCHVIWDWVTKKNLFRRKIPKTPNFQSKHLICMRKICFSLFCFLFRVDNLVSHFRVNEVEDMRQPLTSCILRVLSTALDGAIFSHPTFLLSRFNTMTIFSKKYPNLSLYSTLKSLVLSCNKLMFHLRYRWNVAAQFVSIADHF